jgi:hypothetical protein
MLPEDIDDLFRSSLDDHTSPPPAADALFGRLFREAELEKETQAERLDAYFVQGLQGHATPPGRELWERLEDEHLYPRKKRPAAAWWPMALAAVVALLIVAGGAGIWLRGGNKASRTGTLASRGTSATEAPASGRLATASGAANASKNNTPAIASGISKKTTTPQATGLAAATSSAPEGHQPVAAQAAATRPAARPGQSDQRPTPTVNAGMLARQLPRRSGPAAEKHQGSVARQLPAPGAAQVAATVSQAARRALEQAPQPAPAPTVAPVADVASTGVIEVEVRRGGGIAAGTVAALAAAPAADEDSPRTRLRFKLGGVLDRAGSVVRGAREGLAAVNNLPDNLTVQARVGGRTLSKTIEL